MSSQEDMGSDSSSGYETELSVETYEVIHVQNKRGTCSKERKGISLKRRKYTKRASNHIKRKTGYY